MLDLSSVFDLPLLWAGIVAFAVFMYVILDGFDLGIGILFPFAPSDACRNKMINSIAPFWDGNETWLILGGVAIFAAFPVAYSILMPAFYLPIMLMVASLILRGVAFEFQFKAHTHFTNKMWGYIFHFGSIVAAFFQGVMLGTFVQGVEISGQVYSGDGFEWLTPFSLMSGTAVIFGYALLGSNWLILKADGKTQSWARKCSIYVSFYILGFMGLVSLWMPYINKNIKELWFSYPNIAYLSPVPILVIIVFILHERALTKGSEYPPFILSILLFVLNYFGIAISIWPWIVPYQIDIWQASASPESQSILVVGVLALLPMILGYTAYSYYVFRGKVSEKSFYNH